VEGQISKHWGYLQLLYYHDLHSKWSVNKWTSGLVSHLLELTHGMLVHWNGIDHAVDKQGLPICLAADIEVTIHEEFHKGTDGLDRHDFHFIRCGRDNVMSLSAVDKQGWLRGIQLAWDSQITAPPAHWQQQQLMQDFFGTVDNWFLHSPTTRALVPSPSITQWILSIIRLWWWCPHIIKCGLIKWEVVLWVTPFFFFSYFHPSV
jgi:hypothetical protein